MGSTGEHKATNIHNRLSSIQNHWSPELITKLNDSHSLKVAKIKGDFIWHCHPDTDEVFHCISGGSFHIELNTTASSPEQAQKAGADQVVEMGVGDVFCVPKGMQHRPVAEVESGILIIEKVGTVNTGDKEGDGMTSYVDEA